MVRDYISLNNSVHEIASVKDLILKDGRENYMSGLGNGQEAQRMGRHVGKNRHCCRASRFVNFFFLPPVRGIS